MRLSLVALEISVESSKLRSANSLSFCPKPTVAAQRRSGKAHVGSVMLPDTVQSGFVYKGNSLTGLVSFAMATCAYVYVTGVKCPMGLGVES